MSYLQFPQDLYNAKFLKDVFPIDWQNPQPKESYDLVVIGGGPGGMTAATTAAGQKKKVAIIEKEHFGGECLLGGCIPSKAFLRSSRLVADLSHAGEFGIDIIGKWQVNFPAVMERVRRLRSVISPHDSAEHFRKLGIDVFLGTARFTQPDIVEVDGKLLRFYKAVIATGNLPIRLSLPGLEEAGYLTNQTVFNLTSLPKRLAVIGAGPVGCELSQAFARFGSEVTLITHGIRLLPKEEAIASERLQKVFEREGMQIMLNCALQGVELQGKEKILYYEGSSKGVVVDEILVAAGRTPHVQGLNLEQAGIAFNPRTGITVNDYLQTSNPHVYAIGNVSSRYQFTHIAQEQAQIAVKNALFDATIKSGSLTIPWCTFTDPEIAHTGLYEKDITSIATKSLVMELANIDRAVLDGETAGFVKILVTEDHQRILGATIMARHAGEMISEITLGIAAQLDLETFLRTIHPFPTQSQSIRQAVQALMQMSLAKV